MNRIIINNKVIYQNKIDTSFFDLYLNETPTKKVATIYTLDSCTRLIKKDNEYILTFKGIIDSLTSDIIIKLTNNSEIKQLIIKFSNLNNIYNLEFLRPSSNLILSMKNKNSLEKLSLGSYETISISYLDTILEELLSIITNKHLNFSITSLINYINTYLNEITKYTNKIPTDYKLTL